jgi:outer membrane protein assembly factor BamB
MTYASPHLEPAHAVRTTLRVLTFCLVALLAAPLSPQAAPAQRQGEQAQTVQTSIRLSWPGRSGVRRYRLQLATDEKFEDVVFDRAVEGQQYTVTELPPGTYFWRVATAVAETSSFSKPERVTVGASVAAPASGVLISPEESTGWRVATGEVVRVSAAKLREGAIVDFVGVTSTGKVFAVDGANGLSLWNARAEGAQAATFAPVTVPSRGAAGASVLAGAEGGVRLLRADTGREVWRAKLEGAAASGAVIDSDGDGTNELIVTTRNPAGLYALSVETGRVLASAKLEAEVIGAPVAYAVAGGRGVLLSLASDELQTRGSDLRVSGGLKLDTRLTTAPILVSRGDARVLVVGGERGLIAVQFPEMKVLGQIVSENDPVRGTLASADMDGDGSAEIVLVTRAGRVALVGTNDGNVKWYAEGAAGAESATLADLNGDGVLDVVVPGGDSFALGFSGLDGSMLMRAEEAGSTPKASTGAAPTRTIAVTPSLGGGLLLVGADTAGSGLRAIEVPKGRARAAESRDN